MSILEAARLLQEKVDAELRRIEDVRRDVETHRAQGIVEMEALRAAVEKDRMELEAERRAMEVFNKPEDELVAVNAGGETFTARRSTLCQVEGSMLASMFSGRWDQSLAYDENGAAFVDASPRVFEAVLAHLRALRLDPRSKAPEVAPSLQAEVTAFCKFMMLDVATCTGGEYVVVELNNVECQRGADASAEYAQAILQPSGACGALLCCDGACRVVLRFQRPCLISSATLECLPARLPVSAPVEWQVHHDGAILGRANFVVSDESVSDGSEFTLTFDYPHRIEPGDFLTVSLHNTVCTVCFGIRKLSFF
eukprot:NODE_1424_length_1145_cov_274.667890.p1 GENE.NODE_1424_length_1145_cov_274.667890~~NODE_1424_length_1145_cov_274.667890.p1  ORF type:complete len:343 (-),score=85.48 NODE_1424_length_1145_cov_274.667890:103-1032(-)